MQINRNLRMLANRQWGYFTAAQAEKAGYPNNLQRYHGSRGNWLRIDRALYRLPGYADTPEGEFLRWTLWAAGQSAERLVVVSHESALRYHGLSQTEPEAVHLSVSSVRHQPEAEGVQLHWETLLPGQYEERDGFRITTVLHTLQTMQPDLTLRCRWQETVRLAHQMRQISDAQLQELLPAAQREGNRPEPTSPLPSWAGGMPAANYSYSASAGTHPSWRQPQMRRTGSEIIKARSSFTLVEMLVVIAIIGILAGLMLPSLQKALGATKALQCINNERQLGVAFAAYTTNYDNFMPLVNAWSSNIAPYDWRRALSPYLLATATLSTEQGVYQLLQCPPLTETFLTLSGNATFQKSMSSYGMNGRLGLSNVTSVWRKVTQLTRPSKTLNITEAGYWGSYVSAQQQDGYYLSTLVSLFDGLGVHDGAINILWVDGSASRWPDALRLTMSPYTIGQPDNRWNQGQ